ncbi:hypothetical protein QOK74_08345 [Staphylococcus saprophyticus]|uniref:hypothetical protein n=1 Tax=Staphylococcus saprophyticus TaxID=29385 RepID=UPI0024C421E2|nr:hypothetical protein [Staphylococcus saprophyticus]MDK1672881.1 hypothetical protein [Staphylococcus saprophyticus]
MTNLLNNLNIDEKQAKKIIESGIENVEIIGVINDEDIYNFYINHKERINEIIEIEIGTTIYNANNDYNAFEILINNIGGVNSELEFEDRKELENSELPFIVWYAIEVECMNNYGGF